MNDRKNHRMKLFKNNDTASTEPDLDDETKACRDINDAARNGNVAVVRKILKGVKKSNHQWLATEALRTAAECGHVMLVRLCVCWGGNLDLGLASATYHKQIPIMKECLLMGAKPESAYEIAKWLGDENLKRTIDEMVDRGLSLSPAM